MKKGTEYYRTEVIHNSISIGAWINQIHVFFLTFVTFPRYSKLLRFILLWHLLSLSIIKR